MGQSTDPDPPGNDCLCCFPADGTPSQVYISYTAIEPCDKVYNGIPYPINDVIAVPQDPDFPCYFYRLDNNWQFVWSSCHDGISICGQTHLPNEMFLDHTINNCDIFFTNELDCAGPIIYGHNGNALVMWNIGPADHSVGSLLSSINMEPDPETKFEFWPASGERGCVRFARKSDATNILILVEPTEL